jgi:hypothetical protein
MNGAASVGIEDIRAGNVSGEDRRLMGIIFTGTHEQN